MARHDARTMSAQERTLILVAVIAAAVVTTLLLAAVFVSISPGGVSSQAGPTGSPTQPVHRTPNAARPSSTPTPSVTTPSASPSVSKTTKPPNQAASVGRARPTVVFRPTSSWDDGFVSVVAIRNRTDTPLAWELSFDLQGAEVDDVWQASLGESGGGRVVARGLDYNAVIAPGEWVEFGFRANGSGRPHIRDCTLNGVACRIRRG